MSFLLFLSQLNVAFILLKVKVVTVDAYLHSYIQMGLHKRLCHV
jgi:hypothetical protein